MTGYDTQIFNIALRNWQPYDTYCCVQTVIELCICCVLTTFNKDDDDDDGDAGQRSLSHDVTLRYFSDRQKPVTNKRATLSVGMPPPDGQRTDSRKSMEKCISPRCDLDYRPLTLKTFSEILTRMSADNVGRHAFLRYVIGRQLSVSKITSDNVDWQWRATLSKEISRHTK